jgi:glycosyltransferase involved in cell wall biosynthesis
MTKPLPLATFALFAYNQEAYICEAVEAAFAQVYNPLEIIISDDCSSDGTFEKILDLVNNYSGIHTIRCNRNVRNLGLSGHVNLVNELARGELIIVAAGDDISLPDRVRTIVDAYLKTHRNTHYFYSMVQKFTDTGQLLELAESPGAINAYSTLRTGLSAYPLAIGASQAWTKKLTEAFYPLRSNVWAEDQIFGFRGRLMGPVCFINRPLVKYRFGVGISTKKMNFSIKRYFKLKVDGCIILFQRSLDAYVMHKYFLAFIIAAKGVVLGIFMPLSPFLSGISRVMRKFDGDI